MGIVEVDETYISGKDANRHWNKKHHIRGTGDKVSVIGAISRKGNVVCKMIERTDMPTLHRFVAENHQPPRLIWSPPMSIPAITTGSLAGTSASDRFATAKASMFAATFTLKYRIVLVALETRHRRHLPQCEQEISAAVPCGVYLPIQQSPRSRYLWECDSW